MKFTAKKFCPIMKEPCAQSYCGLWDAEPERCSILSIGLGANNLEDMKQDLYWLRRSVEDNQGGSGFQMSTAPGVEFSGNTGRRAKESVPGARSAAANATGKPSTRSGTPGGGRPRSGPNSAKQNWELALA